MNVFSPIRITDRVYWVGAIDWNIRDFHGYSTSRGTSYNSYLILDEKKVLVDTVKEPFRHEMMSRIRELVNPEDIDIIVSNHSEMDHSGSLAWFAEKTNPEQIYASVMGKIALSEHGIIPADSITPVKSGDTISTGAGELKITETRMLHWPDSMFSYYTADRVLFSQDGFGLHLASSERFADELPEFLVEDELKKYYANILLPYSQQIRNLLEAYSTMGINPDIVANDHGPVWRKNFDKVLSLYGKWSSGKIGRKALVLYDTMWKSTEKMALSIAEGIRNQNIPVKVMNLSIVHRSDVATEILDTGALLVGSPTLNNNLFPTLSDVLTYLKGLRPFPMVGQAFGSYGWSGESVKQVSEYLASMKITPVGEPVKVKYVPTDEDLAACRKLGEETAEALKKSLSEV